MSADKSIGLELNEFEVPPDCCYGRTINNNTLAEFVPIYVCAECHERTVLSLKTESM